jgi:hypothetical protein
MGDDMVQARKDARKKTMILALATAVVGLGVGFGIGGLVKGNEGAQAAVQGAEMLVEEIDAANLKLSELNDVIKAAGSKVKDGEFPADEIEKLGAVEIPFDGTNLTNKGIGRFNATAVTMLLNYSNGVADVKAQKDKIRRLFGAAKKQFEAIAEEKKTPKVHWGVAINDGPHGKWAKMYNLADKAFKAADKKDKWPKEVEVGKSKMELYGGKGAPEGSEFIPVDPSTEPGVCPQTFQFQLLRALGDVREAISGIKTPGHERDGVIDVGEKVLDQLRKIGGPA